MPRICKYGHRYLVAGLVQTLILFSVLSHYSATVVKCLEEAALVIATAPAQPSETDRVFCDYRKPTLTFAPWPTGMPECSDAIALQR
jgi:hypothetical protein